MTDEDGELIAAARAAARAAHAPYSGFHVGAAVRAGDGRIAAGANLENACYRLGQCAETAALAAAAQAFGLDEVTAIAIAGGRIVDGALSGAVLVTPCGGCRQAIAEVAAVAGRDMRVIAASGDGSAARVFAISELLPQAFGPDAFNPDDLRPA